LLNTVPLREDTNGVLRTNNFEIGVAHVLTRDVSQGDQLYNWYGPHDNFRLLEWYGFTHRLNQLDFVELPLLDPDETKNDLLEQLSGGEWKPKLLWHGVTPQDSLLLRIYVQPWSSLDSVFVSRIFSAKLNFNDNLQVMSYVVKAIRYVIDTKYGLTEFVWRQRVAKLGTYPLKCNGLSLNSSFDDISACNSVKILRYTQGLLQLLIKNLRDIDKVLKKYQKPTKK